MAKNDQIATTASKNRLALLARSAAGGKFVQKGNQKPSIDRVKVRDALRAARKSD